MTVAADAQVCWPLGTLPQYLAGLKISYDASFRSWPEIGRKTLGVVDKVFPSDKAVELKVVICCQSRHSSFAGI